MQKSRDDKEAPWKRPHLMLFRLYVMDALEWWRCKVVFYDFILSEMKRTEVGYTLYISIVLLIHEWGTLSNAFFIIDPCG